MTLSEWWYKYSKIWLKDKNIKNMTMLELEI